VAAPGHAAPLATDAQQTPKVWRIGYLAEVPRLPDRPVEAFVDQLRELGYAEGDNLVIEYRFADNRTERLPALAANLVRMNVDLIAAAGTREVLALKAATTTIPIVMLFPGDPVGTGLVSSLTRPGGNITGTSLIAPDIGGKQIEFLREMAPAARAFAVVWNSRNVSSDTMKRSIDRAATTLAVVVHGVDINSVDHLDRARRLGSTPTRRGRGAPGCDHVRPSPGDRRGDVPQTVAVRRAGP
jgi:putative ABC transport system substrate-binding protein